MNILFIITTLFLTSFELYSSDKGMHGVDNREETVLVSIPLMRAAARSVPAMVGRDRIINNTIRYKRLKDTLVTIGPQSGARPCPGIRYEEQPAAVYCSGFLISDDLLVTAGHCVSEKNSCQNNSWIFDLTLSKSEISAPPESLTFDPKNRYECKEIVGAIYKSATPIYPSGTAGIPNLANIMQPIGWDYSTQLDLAVIRLNRKVTGRRALNYNHETKVSEGTPLFAVGYPLGLPQKITAFGSVIDNKRPNTFFSNLDLFYGNSGSPVFEEKSGDVVGIVIGGPYSFEYNEKLDCAEEIIFPDNPRDPEERELVMNSHFISTLIP